MRKTYLSLAVVAIVMAGCSKQHTIDSDSLGKSGRLIVADSYVNRPSSKATIVDLAKLKDKDKGMGFNVWAYVTQDVNDANATFKDADKITAHDLKGDAERFYWSEYIINTDKKSDWSPLTNKFYYWPDDSKGLMSFFALSTSEGATTGVNNIVGLSNFTPATTAGESTTFDFTIQDEFNQVDLLAAQTYNQQYDMGVVGKEGVVNYTFKHLLTQVRFRLTSATPSMRAKLLKIEVQNATNKGTFTFDADETSIGSWVQSTNVADKANYLSFYVSCILIRDIAEYTNGFPKHHSTDPN